MIDDMLENSAERHGSDIAVVDGSRRITYASLNAQVNALADRLVAGGVRPSDRVAIFLDNSIEAVVAIFAVLRAGAAFVMLHPTTKQARLTYKLQNAGASAVIAARGKMPLVMASLGEAKSVVLVVDVAPTGASPSPSVIDGATCFAFALTDDLLPSDAPARAHPRRAIDQDLATLLYTSGSTGEPKGVMLLHRNVEAAVASIVSYLRLRKDDVIAVVLPLSFGYGLTQLFSTFAVGARLVLEKGMAFPHVTLTKFTEEKVTGFGMVPTIAAVLLGMDLSKYDLASLRFITNAGDALPVDHVKRVRAVLPHVDLVCMYGQSECLRISYLEPDELAMRMGSVGRGMPNTEIYLVDDDGKSAPDLAQGELVVRGSHVMSGYWQLPAETAAKLKPGKWPGERVLHTGDVFRKDADGYFYFVGRKDDIIKTKGEKVSPREVEEAILRLDGVAEAAVVGVPDPVFGLAIKAVVVLRAGVTFHPKQIQFHCAQALEDYMVPKIVEIASELPKTDTGKVLRRALVSD